MPRFCTRSPGRPAAFAMLTAPTALAALVLATPGPLAAQGFGIYEQGTCVMGRAGATVAQPCGDASAAFFNPAGLESLGEARLTFGVTGILADGTFQPEAGGDASALETPPIPSPHLFLGFEATPGWALGLGVYAPYGLVTEWPLDFEGRFVGYDNSLRTLYVQPTVAWRPADRVALGAGMTAAWSDLRIRRREDLAPVPVPPGHGSLPGRSFAEHGVPAGTDYADLTLDGRSDGIAIGFHLGILYDATETLTVGARYLSAVDMRYTGTADFEAVDPGITLGESNPFGAARGTTLAELLRNTATYAPGGPLGDQDFETSLTLPSQLVVGLALEASRDVMLSLDWQRTAWQSFDTVRIEFAHDVTPDAVLEQGFEATSTLRAGLEWSLDADAALRAGYVWNEAAAPDHAVTPLLPEADRNAVTAGLGFTLDDVTVDLAYMYIAQEDRRGRVRNPAPGEPAATTPTRGVYAFHGHLLGLSLGLGF